MGPAQAIRTAFAKSFQFSGLTTPREFWWPFCFLLVVLFLIWTAAIQSSNYQTSALNLMLNMGFFALTLPVFTLGLRRLRDAGSSRVALGCATAVNFFFGLYVCLFAFGEGSSEELEGLAIFTAVIMPLPVFISVVVGVYFWTRPSIPISNEVLP